jgi:hypothetical protein
VRGLSSKQGIGEWGAWWRRLLVIFTLAAFAQAGFVTQTHIHPLSTPTNGVSIAQSGHGKLPAPDDPAHCPLCQEYLLAGVYVAPPPVVLPLPAVAVFQAYLFVRALPRLTAVSHGWHGRAPPLN